METDRLNGWKEIAEVLGKGVRSVQRWEKNYGLPVHRIGDAGGEIVYGFRSEISAWQRRAEVKEPEALEPPTAAQPSPSKTVHRSRFTLVPLFVVLGFLVAAAGLAVATWRERPTSPPVTDWVVEDNALTILGADGRAAWTHRFDVPVLAAPYVRSQFGADLAPGSERIQFVDLDGDGTREVLMLFFTESRRDEAILCFEADGRLRFRFALTDNVRFGDTDYGSPWSPYRLFTVRHGDGTVSVWTVFIHGRWFPSAAVELDRSGAVKQKYWSNGYVTLVGSLVSGGREKVVIGAANNEHGGASLAVFDRNAVTGAAPAAKRAYACTTCPMGGPEEYVVFPGACMVRATEGTAEVALLQSEGEARLAVLVTHGLWHLPGIPTRFRPGVWYEFGPGLALERIEVTAELRRVHEKLRRDGLIDHPFQLDDAHGGLPVLRWSRGRFTHVVMTRPAR